MAFFNRNRHLSAFFLLFSLGLSLLLTACGDTTTSSSPATGTTIAAPTSLIHAGELTVGSDTTYTPMEFVDTVSGGYQGFDIDLIKAIAGKMGLQEKTQQTGFDTIFNDLSNKRFDLVISSVTINSDREKKYDFVPYFKAGESLLVAKGNPKHITSADNLCGLNIGVQTGTTEQDDLNAAQTVCKQNGKADIKLTVLDAQTDVIQLLAAGRVDATYQDSPVTDYYNKINPGHFEVGGPVVKYAPYGITIRKGDTSTYNAVKAALAALKTDGTYNSFFTKWGFSEAQKD